MRQWFPFSDYDFYGYLSSGALLLFALDYWHSGSDMMLAQSLTFMQGVLAVSLAYFAGQLIAIPSSTFLENFLGRHVLRHPVLILLTEPRIYEKLIRHLFVGGYYSQLANGTRQRILQRAAIDEGISEADIYADVDTIFQPAYRAARRNNDACKRMDDFRNQYGFARNIAMSALVCSLLMFNRAAEDPNAMMLACSSLILFGGMLVRFIKFYTCFTREVLQTYGYKE